MKYLEKTLRFNAILEDVEKINPLFSKANIKVLYHGLNRNNSNIDKSVVEDAIYSIYNIPIIGEFLEDKDNFGGHGGKIEITDQGIKYIETTKPYGVVPSDAKVFWQTITDENGEEKEYLIVEGAYLWTGRYPELEDLLGNFYNQSMEIEVSKGEFKKIDGKDVYDIQEFAFSALCILGIDKDGEGEVEPCFEDSTIIAYSLDKNSFKKEFNQMIAELKFSLSNEGGNNKVDKKLELLKKYSLTEEEFKTKLEKPLEDFSLEDLEVELKKLTTADPEAEFALTAGQLRDEIRTELYKATYEDDGYEYRSYWYLDHTDEMVIAEDSENGWRLVGFSYSVNGDVVSIDFESKKRVKIVYEEMETNEDLEFSIASKERMEYGLEMKEQELKEMFTKEKEDALEKANADFSVLEKEVKSLRKFKEEKLSTERQEKETELFDKFSNKLTEDELSSVKKIASELTLEDIEEKLFSLLGKKKFSLDNEEIDLASIPQNTAQKNSGNSYDKLIEKFL